MDVLLGGGRCVGVAVKLRAFVAFPFDARRRYYAKGAGVLRGQIMHYGGVRPVGAELGRVRQSGVEEEPIKPWSPLPVRINGHWDEDGLAVKKLPDQRVARYLVLGDCVNCAIPHGFQELVCLQMFDGSGRDGFFNRIRRKVACMRPLK